MPPKNKFNHKTSTSKKATPIPQKGTPQPKKPTPKKPAIRRKSKKNRGNDSLEDDAAYKTSEKGKINGFEMMAINLCNQSPSKINLTLCQVKDQLNTKKTRQSSPHQIHSHGTINEKLESMCPHYHVMNELMGGQAFINPWFN
ncbi:uncharacterized protein VP01_4719g2, partial [Puccinia sorghi]